MDKKKLVHSYFFSKQSVDIHWVLENLPTYQNRKKDKMGAGWHTRFTQNPITIIDLFQIKYFKSYPPDQKQAVACPCKNLIASR